MNEQKAGRTRELIASYRYSVNRLQLQTRRVRPAATARERPRQVIVDIVDGNVMEKKQSRPITPAVIEKEALDKEMMSLKKINKALSSENAKLKTNNLSLEEQVRKLKDALEEQPKTRHLVRTESATTTTIFSILKKDLEETKRENMTLKQDMKCARLTELQAQRKIKAAQIERFKELLQQEKRVNEGLKRERREMRGQYGNKRNEMQDAIRKLKQEIHYLRLGNLPAADKVRARYGIMMRKFEHLSPMTLELKTEIQSLKKQLEKSQQQMNELRNHLTRSLKATKDEGIQADQKCPKCKSLRSQNTKSKSKIQQLKAQIKQLSKNRVMDDEMIRPTVDESNHLRRFLTLRLTELGISLDQATDLFQGLDENSTEMSLLDLVGIFPAEPFGFVTNRYHQIMAFHLCLSDQQNNYNGNITICENKTFSIDSIRHNFRRFLGEFTLPSQPQRKELFQTVAEFLSDLDTYSRILELLEMSSNEDGMSINEDNFRRVMSDCGVDQDCIVEMMRKMVMGSPDLDHLYFRILFQVFVVEEDQNDNQLSQSHQDVPI